MDILDEMDEMADTLYVTGLYMGFLGLLIACVFLMGLASGWLG